VAFWVLVVLACGALAAWWGAQGVRPVAPPPAMSVEPLTPGDGALSVAVSTDGLHLAWVESTGAGARVWVQPFGEGSPTERIPARAVEYQGLAFAPDGQTIYASTRSPEFPGGRLTASSLMGGEPALVLDGIASGIAVSPTDGRLAFYRADYPRRNTAALVVSATDGSEMEAVLTRPSRGIPAPAFGAAPSWSPDGTRVAAALRDAAGHSTLVAVNVGSGMTESFAGRFSAVWSVAWLPDASGLLVAGSAMADPWGASQLWLQPYPTGDVRRLTEAGRDYRSLAVHPDGAFVAVGLDADHAVWNAPLDDGPRSRIASEPHDGLDGVAPLPDGRAIVSIGEHGATQLALIDRDGATRQILTTRGANSWPAVTPDGAAVVFVSDRDGETGIWRLNLDGSEPMLLAHIPSPSWLSVTPDAQFVLCAAPAARDAAVATWRIAIAGGEPAIVAPGIDRPTVSPDGLTLAGVSVTPGAEAATVVTMRLDGRAPPRTLEARAVARTWGLLEWAPRGQGLLFSAIDGSTVWSEPFDGQSETALTNLAGLDVVRGRRTPDGSSLVVVSRTRRSGLFLVTGVR
jgi:TolB protein